LKILILKPSSLGDVIQALPVLRLLKLHWPHSEIHWWIDSAFASLLEHDPDLKGIVRFERRRWGKPIYWPEMIRSIQWLRAQHFDLVIDLQCLARSGSFAWLTRGEFLIGLDEAREGARGFYDIAVPRMSFETHAVDWYLSVLDWLNVPVHFDFQWLPPQIATAAAVQQRWFTAENRWVVLQPGARWDNKRWPVEYFAALVQAMSGEYPGVRFAILGGKDDQPLGATISHAAPDRCLNLCGQTTLPEMVECVRLSDLMVTNDTGPMHVAAALDKPMVGIFGPTDPRRTGPYRRPETVIRVELPCAPCLKSRCAYLKPMECLRAISPGMVLERVHQQLPVSSA